MDEVLEELGKIKDEEITKELVGEWIWVGGYTWPHRETLKKLGFKWASKKKCGTGEQKKTKSEGMENSLRSKKLKKDIAHKHSKGVRPLGNIKKIDR